MLASTRFADTHFGIRLDDRCFVASAPRLNVSGLVSKLAQTPHGFLACFDAARFDRSNPVRLLLPFLA
jgi:hypothetical protein